MFSVIIPTRNRPAYLREAIASVLAQTFSDLELLVVDDGDGSGLAVARAMSDPRIVCCDNNRRGPTPARNGGVARASKPFIAFLDDDDWWQDRRHLERAKSALTAGADFWFANGDLVFEDGSEPPLPFEYEATRETLALDNTILISAVAYRRSLHDRLKDFDETIPYYWDWDWYLRVARAGAVLHHETARSVAIRCHASNMSGAGAEAARRENLARLAAKHSLGSLELKDHLSLARAK